MEGTRKTVLLIVALSSFVIPFITSAVNIALPAIGRELKLSALLLSWVATSYLLSVAVFLLPLGRVGDILGRRRIFLLGMIIFTIASTSIFWVQSIFPLLFLRVLQGVGSAMVFATGIAILISVYPERRRGEVIGLIIGATYTALALGPGLGGILIHHLGWRSIFIISLPFGLAIILPTLLFLQPEPKIKRDRFDLIGAIFYGIGLFLIIYGFSVIKEGYGLPLLLVGLLFLLFFILQERRTRTPILDFGLLLTNRLFTLSNLTALIMYSATFATSFLLSLYLQFLRGLSPQSAGFILLSRRAVQALFSPKAGSLSDRIEPRIIASVGMGITSIGLLLLNSLSQDSPLLMVIVALVILGIGFALFSSPNTSAIMGSIPAQNYGIAAAMNGTMRVIGQTISMGIATLIIASIMGNLQLRAQTGGLFLKSTKITIIVFLILSGAGLIASILRGRVR